MIRVEIDTTVLGYGVPKTEIEIEKNEIQDMSEDEVLEYIYKQAYEYVMETLEVGFEIIE